MEIIKVCKSYLTLPLETIKNFGKTDLKIKLIALSIFVSYSTILTPLSIGITYGVLLGVNWLSKKLSKNPETPQNVIINSKAQSNFTNNSTGPTQNSVNQTNKTSAMPQKDLEFWQSITPDNIDQKLNITKKGWCTEIKKNYFSLVKHVSKELKIGDEVMIKAGKISYSGCLQDDEKSWTGTSLEIENKSFKHYQNGTADTYHYFNNFCEYLLFLFKGDFYQGEHFKADFYIFLKNDNTEITIHNPFKSS